MIELPLPDGWCEAPLLEVVPSVQYGVSVPLEEGEDGIPVMRMNNLRNGAMDVHDIKRSSSPQAMGLKLQIGDVLFNRTNSIEHVGRTSLWRDELESASFASYLVRLVPNRARLEPEYLVSWLNMPATQLLIRRFATPGVHQVNINPTNLRRVRIVLPKDTARQRRIAEILSTVDEAMEQTEALMAKLQQMKAGLMHDLFTRGVSLDGHLRPTRTEAPHLYHQTPLGWLPKEWEVRCYRDVCERVSVGIATSTTNYFVESGIPILRNQNIRPGYIQVTDVLHISTQFAEINRSKKLRSGDVITVRTGYPGTSAVVPPEMEGWQTFTTLISTPNQNVVFASFICHVLNSEVGMAQIARLQGGGAQQNLNVGWLNGFLVGCPRLDEQQDISNRIEAIDCVINQHQKEASKLRQQKQGLMQDLLTGRVPVKV